MTFSFPNQEGGRMLSEGEDGQCEGGRVDISSGATVADGGCETEQCVHRYVVYYVLHGWGRKRCRGCDGSVCRNDWSGSSSGRCNIGRGRADRGGARPVVCFVGLRGERTFSPGLCRCRRRGYEDGATRPHMPLSDVRRATFRDCVETPSIRVRHSRAIRTQVLRWGARWRCSL